MHWLGILPHEIPSLGIASNQFLPLTSKEQSLLTGFQKRLKTNHSIVAKTILKQAEILLNLGHKIEIEALYTINNRYLVQQYLAGKIMEHFSKPSPM